MILRFSAKIWTEDGMKFKVLKSKESWITSKKGKRNNILSDFQLESSSTIYRKAHFYKKRGYLSVDNLFKPNIELLLSAQRALFRSIPKNTKAIFTKIENNHLIWKVFFDKEPTENEKNILSIAATEIIADFPEINSCKEEYIYHPSPINFKNEVYYNWPYTRLE